jgi:hypothetical protein
MGMAGLVLYAQLSRRFRKYQILLKHGVGQCSACHPSILISTEISWLLTHFALHA